MKFRDLLSSVSLAALALGVVQASVRAQEQLPTIDVGAPSAARTTSEGPGLGWNPGAGGYGGAGPAQDPFNTSYVLRDVSVGTKTETPVMETPLNVQSVSQQVLQDQQITDLGEALKNVSGVTIAHGAADNGNPYDKIQIRGFATDNIYRDGFRVANGAGFGLQQFANVASVEVLKGPGATVYGLSEPGGLVNIITKQPLDAPYYAVNQQIGSLAEYRTTIDATGPLNADKSLLYRMNMSYENNGAPFGSFVDNTHAQAVFLAPIIKWNIDADNWVKLEAQYNKLDDSTFWPNDPTINGVFVNIPRNLNYGQYSPTNNENIFAALTWSHKFDKDWSIIQQIAFNRLTQDSTIRFGTTVDAAAWPFPSLAFGCCGTFTPPVYDRFYGNNFYSYQTLSTNVDVTGHVETGPIQHTLLFGGDFYKEMAYTQYYLSATTSPINIFAPAQPGIPFTLPLVPGNGGLGGEQTSPIDTAGLYVQDQMKLPYNLFLTASARYQYIRQNGGELGSPSFAFNWFNVNGSPPSAEQLQAVTPRFGLLWRPASWVSGYIHYAEGFGQNPGFAYPFNPLPPTGAREAEVGVKVELFDGRLRGTAAYYDLTKTNVPTPDLNAFHVCPGGACSIAVGAVRSKGVEVDVQGEIVPGWRVILAYTNQDVIVTKTYAGDTTTVNTIGQPFPITPRNIASFQTVYEFQDGAFKGLKLGGGYYYYGAARAYDATSLDLGWLTPSIPGYGTVNLLADYSYFVGDTKVNLGININNLFDRTYYTAAAYSTGTGQSPAVGGLGSFVGLAPGLRTYGAPFSVLGHIGAEFPGRPSKLYAAPSAYLPTQADWTGFYVGGQVGYAWGDNAGSFTYATPDGFSGSPSLAQDAQGVIPGVHLGYNHQFDNNWLVGLEGSVDGTNLSKFEALGWSNPASIGGYKGYTSCFALAYPCFDGTYGGSVTAKISSDIQGAVRARLGYAWNRLLFYGAGGVALAKFNLQSNLAGVMPDPNPANFFTYPDSLFYYAAAKDRSTTQVGWTLGGGLEYAVNSNWSVRAEYRYSDFGHIAETPTSFSDGMEYYHGDRHVTQNQVQVGFSYRFAAPDPEPAPGNLIVKGPTVGASLPLPSSAGAPPKAPTPAVPLVVDWTGFYVGGQTGYAYGDNHGGYNYEAPGLTTTLPSSGALIGDAQGVIVGAHLGYNLEFDKWLVGFEGEVDGTSLIRRNQLNLNDPALGTNIGVLSTLVQSDIQGSIRGRAGYSFGRLLTFVTGGVALADFSLQSQLGALDTNAAGAQLFSYATKGLQSTTRVGWTVGGGLEWAVNNNWSVRGEYRYTDFGSMQDTPSTSAILGSYYSGLRHLDQNQVQFGFSYKFGEAALAPVIAKY